MLAEVFADGLFYLFFYRKMNRWSTWAFAAFYSPIRQIRRSLASDRHGSPHGGSRNKRRFHSVERRRNAEPGTLEDGKAASRSINCDPSSQDLKKAAAQHHAPVALFSTEETLDGLL